MDPTNAQVTDPNQIPETPVADSPQQNPGLQARFDELTAAKYAAQRERDELAARMAAMEAQMAQAQLAASQRLQSPEVDPLNKYREALDPRLVEVMEAQKRQYENALAAKSMQMEVELGKARLQQQALTSPGVAPYVAEALKLYEQARVSGSRATPEEALYHVIGVATAKQLQRAAPVMGIPPGTYNANNSYLPPSAAPAAQQSSLPADFENRPLQEQIRLMEAAGLGDSIL